MRKKVNNEISKRQGLSLKAVGWIITSAALVISIVLIVSLYLLSNKYNRVRNSTVSYMEWKNTALDIQLGSDNLTEQVRSYVVTENSIYLKNYFIEVESKRREQALEIIKKYLSGTVIYSHLQTALDESQKLMLEEYYAMRLIVEATNTPITSELPEQIREIDLKDDDAGKNSAELRQKAIDIVFGEDYNDSKVIIVGSVNDAVYKLDNMMEKDVIDSAEELKVILIIQQALIIANILFNVTLIILMYSHVIRPVNQAVHALVNNEEVEVIGSKEYRYLAQTYNNIREQNNRHREKLLFEAEHDQLTGLFNRTGYDVFYPRIDLSKACYILVDVDKFKEVNDNYGHAAGDKVLVKLSKTLKKYFEADNTYIFRIGGDEFSVIIEGEAQNIKDELVEKIDKINADLMHSSGTKISISAGIAFGTNGDTTDTLFKKADKALYSIKNNGRSGANIYTK